jgi:hypothetical protein
MVEVTFSCTTGVASLGELGILGKFNTLAVADKKSVSKKLLESTDSRSSPIKGAVSLALDVLS